MVFQNVDQLEKEIEKLSNLIAVTENQETREGYKLNLSNIKKGLESERKAAFEIQRGLPFETAIINSLKVTAKVSGRLRSAQIDHLAIMPNGKVILFETKHYSTGVKIKPNGGFLYWLKRERKYKTVNSPIKQSLAHEEVFSEFLKERDIKVKSFHHVIVVDYKDKLLKPKDGFENVCSLEDVSNYLQELSTLTIWDRIKMKLFKDKYFSPTFVAQEILLSQSKKAP